MVWVGADPSRDKIAHVITESGPFGGAQRNTLLTLKGLLRDGHRVELVCGPGGRLIPEARAIGVTVHVIPDLVRPVSPVRDCRALFRLLRLFEAERYLLVHTHSTKAGLLGRVAAWWAGVPIVIHTVHGLPFEIDAGLHSTVYLILERMVGRVTHRVVCVGEVLRQEFAAWHIAPDHRLVTIYSGLEISSYLPQRARSQTRALLDAEGAWPLIGCVGRLSEAKAQYILVEAVGRLRNRYPRIKLLLVGEGELRPRLERQIDGCGLAGHVSLLGERDDVADLYMAFDLYAMSSQWEGVGRALSEAMYFGLPIAATAVYGVQEVIVHEKTGLLVSPRDPAGLAAAIDRLAADPGLAGRLGANARRKALELMDGERMISALEELYAQEIERLPGRAASPSEVLPKGMGVR